MQNSQNSQEKYHIFIALSCKKQSQHKRNVLLCAEYECRIPGEVALKMQKKHRVNNIALETQQPA